MTRGIGNAIYVITFNFIFFVILIFKLLKVLATFDNGRIEAYLPMRPLKPAEMVTKAMASRIAQRLKQFHSIKGVEAPSTPELFTTISSW